MSEECRKHWNCYYNTLDIGKNTSLSDERDIYVYIYIVLKFLNNDDRHWVGIKAVHNKNTQNEYIEEIGKVFVKNKVKQSKTEKDQRTI